MQLKKAGGKVYGAVLTAAEKKAMDLEIQREMVRDIRLVRALLLYDMAKDLDISPAELSAIECGRKNVPDWFVSKLQETYGISDMHAQSLIKYMNERG